MPIYEDLIYDVLLNDPSFFEENDNWEWNPWNPDDSTLARILANSSKDAWIDDDSDGVRDPGEVVGEFPVVIVQQEILLISDPSIFTNDLYYRHDNRDFAHALINKLLPYGGTVIFDEGIHLEPGLLSELDDVIVRPLTMVFGETWPVYTGLLLLIVSMATLGLGIRRGLRKFSRHMDRLHEPRRMEFGHSYNWLSDYYEVRGVLLQRMRYAYGLDPDDLQRLPPEIIAQLLGDQYLVQFVLQPLRVDPVALEAALGDIAGWEPPPHAEALVVQAERFLANLPTDALASWATPKAPPAWQGPGGQRAQQGYPQGPPQG